MMTSSGRQPQRANGSRIRHPISSAHSRYITVVVVLLLVLGASPWASAQDEGQPKHAIQAPLASRSLALDAAAVDGKIVVVGERGHILISEDLGVSWTQSDVPTRAVLTAVFFHDPSLGWAVGHDSVILRTADGGTTWEREYWAPEEEAPFFDVWFSDAEHGVAIGAYGSYYTSSDGGVTWDFEPIGDSDWHLHQISQAGNGRLYIAAEAGVAYRSDDNGTTWTELPSPYEGSFFGVLPLDNDVVLLFGLRGHLFRSEDAGESWSAIETGTVAMLTDGIRLTDGRIVITGLSGTLLVSEDGGKSFELREQASRRGIEAVVQASQDSLLLVGEFGVRMLPMSELAGGKGK